MKPILVTGATGFLGKHLVEQLLRNGAGPVRVLCRGEGLAGTELVRGDITIASDVERAVSGVRQIYHLAGLVSRNPADTPKMKQIHVEGTRLVCEAALRQGVERVVLASSSGTVAVSREPVEHDERSGYKADVAKNWGYYVTKIEQEMLALRFHRERGLPLLSVNPSLLLGPGDDRGSSTGDVAAFLGGQVLSLPAGGLNFVDARDCAAGTIAAMQKGRLGERYLLGGPNWTFREFFQALAAISGTSAPKMSSPAWLSLATAPLLRRAMPLVGRKFDIDDESIQMSAHFWYCDSSKAKSELGFVTRDPKETLRDTVAYLQAHAR